MGVPSSQLVRSKTDALNESKVQTLAATTDTEWSRHKRHKSRPLQATALPKNCVAIKKSAKCTTLWNRLFSNLPHYPKHLKLNDITLSARLNPKKRWSHLGSFTRSFTFQARTFQQDSIHCARARLHSKVHLTKSEGI